MTLDQNLSPTLQVPHPMQGHHPLVQRRHQLAASGKSQHSIFSPRPFPRQIPGPSKRPSSVGEAPKVYCSHGMQLIYQPVAALCQSTPLLTNNALICQAAATRRAHIRARRKPGGITQRSVFPSGPKMSKHRCFNAGDSSVNPFPTRCGTGITDITTAHSTCTRQQVAARGNDVLSHTCLRQPAGGGPSNA